MKYLSQTTLYLAYVLRGNVNRNKNSISKNISNRHADIDVPHRVLDAVRWSNERRSGARMPAALALFVAVFCTILLPSGKSIAEEAECTKHVANILSKTLEGAKRGEDSNSLNSELMAALDNYRCDELDLKKIADQPGVVYISFFRSKYIVFDAINKKPGAMIRFILNLESLKFSDASFYYNPF